MKCLRKGELILSENKTKEKNKNENNHKEHRKRLRATIEKTGVEGLPEHNLLEFLLFYSIPRKNTNDIAHNLINTFGSLNRVFEASYEQLLEVEGVGESSALLLSVIPDICRRYADEKKKGQKINISDPEAAKNYIIDKYYGCKNEVFYMISLDALGNVINCVKLGEGTPGTVLVDKRSVLENAFRTKADKVIFAHNHPNGIAAPSKEDLAMTSEFSSVLSGVGIRLADHLIVADDGVLSLASIEKFSALFI